MKKQRLSKILISVLVALAAVLLPVAPAFAMESTATWTPFVKDGLIANGEEFNCGMSINYYKYSDLGIDSYVDLEFDYVESNKYYILLEYGENKYTIETVVSKGSAYYKFTSVTNSNVYVMVGGLSDDTEQVYVSVNGCAEVFDDFNVNNNFKLWLGYQDIWKIDGGNISSGEMNQSGSDIRPEFEGGFQYGSSGALMLDCVTARDNLEQPGSYVAVYEGNLNVNYSMYPVEKYTYYTGAAFFYLTLNRETSDGDAIAFGDPNVWISDLNTPDDSYRVTFGVNQVTPDKVRLIVCMYFNNYYVTTAASPNVNFTLNMRQSVVIPDLSEITQYSWEGYSDQDWAGTIFATKSPANQDIDSVYDAADQQMEQQEQIAQEQAARDESLASAEREQESEQHEELINGFDNNEAESGQAEFENALSDFESQEHALLEDAMSDINDVELDTSVFEQLIPTFEFIRIVFMSIVNAMGDFGVLITITLSICLALFAIGWFRS